MDNGEEGQASAVMVNENQSYFNALLESVTPATKSNIKLLFKILLKKLEPVTVEDFILLDNFGTELASVNKLLQSQVCFHEILTLNSDFLRSYQNLENVNNKLVERWHYRMLNDIHRNTAFKNAIQSTLATPTETGNTESKRVLDIGTGTGILSLYAHQMGATSIVACDDSSVMVTMAKQVFVANDMSDTTQLFNKYSCDLTEEEIGGRVDVVVTETLDCAGFGEGILQSLIHAKEHLLKSLGRVIPSSIKLYIAGFESKTIAMENVCTNGSFTDLIYLKGCRLVAATNEPYDSENVRQIKDFKIVTTIHEAFTCDFNDLDEMKRCYAGVEEKKVRLIFERAGFLDGFVVWFSLKMDDTNCVETKPSGQSCWDQALFKLNHRFANFEKLKYLNVTVSCKDGILKVSHYYNYPGKVFSVTPDMIKFINDTEYLNKLENDFFSGAGSRRSGSDATTDLPNRKLAYRNVLDFSPFPYIGISLMKEKRAERLYCSKESKDFIYYVATCNCLNVENIIFIEEPSDVLYVGDNFDVIILSPIDTMGGVNSRQISNYTILKTNKLTTNGVMIPHRIEMWGQIITSEWLEHVTRVTNPDVSDMGIADLINQYATTNQLNLLCFDHEKLSNPFLVAEMNMDDEYAEKFTVIKLKPSDKEVNGILYFYNIFVTSTAEPISTRRNASYIKRACFVIGEEQRPSDHTKVVVHYTQNHGVVKCKLGR